MIAEMYVQMGRYYDSLETTDLEVEDRARLADQQLWLAERRDLVSERKPTAATLNLTKVIGAAVEATFPDRKSRDALRRLWARDERGFPCARLVSLPESGFRSRRSTHRHWRGQSWWWSRDSLRNHSSAPTVS